MVGDTGCIGARLMGKSKAKRKAASKPAAPVAMRTQRQCSHAQCDATCKATQAPRITKKDLPARAFGAHEDVTTALELLRRVTVEALATVERRSGVVVGRPEEGAGLELRDGYPTSLRSGPGTRGRAERLCHEEVVVHGETLRCDARLPCEVHSPADEDLSQLPGSDYADPAGELGADLADGAEWIERGGMPSAVRRFYRHLTKAVDQVVLVEAMLADLLRSPLAGRSSSVGSCRACDRIVAGVEGDRLRNGYCPACAEAWRRRCQTTEGEVDRDAFETDRRERRRKAEAA